jgi:hypothetical protein
MLPRFAVVITPAIEYAEKIPQLDTVLLPEIKPENLIASEPWSLDERTT